MTKTESKKASKTSVKGTIQNEILSKLITVEFASFSSLKPKAVASNTYAYHLKQMLAEGWVTKSEHGYSLGLRGISFAERSQEQKPVRLQPNVKIALFVQDEEGRLLLKARTVQPYIACLGLPVVPATVADISITEAAKWGAKTLLHMVPPDVKHAGSCYVRIYKDKIALTSTLNHVVRFTVASGSKLPAGLEWSDLISLSERKLVPGDNQIISRTAFGDDFFFEEFVINLSDLPQFFP